MIFDKHANIVAESQQEFPQYYPNPGYVVYPFGNKTGLMRFHVGGMTTTLKKSRQPLMRVLMKHARHWRNLAGQRGA
jgi:hypothetical protein